MAAAPPRGFSETQCPSLALQKLFLSPPLESVLLKAHPGWGPLGWFPLAVS